MGTIYLPPEREVGEPPAFDLDDFNKYEEDVIEYVQGIKDYAKEHGTGKYAGEEIYFGVADGHARYVVLSLKPVKLIHIDVDDCYEFQYANRLTASDIKDKVESHKKMKALFAN